MAEQELYINITKVGNNYILYFILYYVYFEVKSILLLYLILLSYCFTLLTLYNKYVDVGQLFI